MVGVGFVALVGEGSAAPSPGHVVSDVGPPVFKEFMAGWVRGDMRDEPLAG